MWSVQVYCLHHAHGRSGFNVVRIECGTTVNFFSFKLGGDCPKTAF
jgi:hypothetical protein